MIYTAHLKLAPQYRQHTAELIHTLHKRLDAVEIIFQNFNKVVPSPVVVDDLLDRLFTGAMADLCP